jgi:hypothetical protein
MDEKSPPELTSFSDSVPPTESPRLVMRILDQELSVTPPTEFSRPCISSQLYMKTRGHDEAEKEAAARERLESMGVDWDDYGDAIRELNKEFPGADITSLEKAPPKRRKR